MTKQVVRNYDNVKWLRKLAIAFKRKFSIEFLTNVSSKLSPALVAMVANLLWYYRGCLRQRCKLQGMLLKKLP